MSFHHARWTHPSSVSPPFFGTRSSAARPGIEASTFASTFFTALQSSSTRTNGGSAPVNVDANEADEPGLFFGGDDDSLGVDQSRTTKTPTTAANTRAASVHTRTGQR